MTSHVKHFLKGKSKDLGDGFFVHRTLPSIKQRMVGPFIFWDHMGPTTLKPEQEMVVRAHPHIGLSTITYLFSGHITHRDSLGNKMDIKPGEVNWMTAGSGIAHSERVHKRDSTLDLEGIQLWVALPQEAEEVEASFVHHKESELPMIEQEGFRLRLIAGEALEKKSPLPVFSPLFYLNGQCSQSGEMTFPVSSDQEAAIYVVAGEIEVGGQTLDKFSMAILEKGSDIKLQSKGAAEFMIFGGEPFPEGRTIWWNFVSSSKDKIEAAKKRWLDDDFGQVIDEDQRIPLPEN